MKLLLFYVKYSGQSHDEMCISKKIIPEKKKVNSREEEPIRKPVLIVRIQYDEFMLGQETMKMEIRD